jgi:hypothetical protein
MIGGKVIQARLQVATPRISVAPVSLIPSRFTPKYLLTTTITDTQVSNDDIFSRTIHNSPLRIRLSQQQKKRSSKTAKLNRLRTLFRSFSGTAKHNNMAWRCSGSSNKELVDNLFKGGLITSSRVRDAMMRVCPPLSRFPLPGEKLCCISLNY